MSEHGHEQFDHYIILGTSVHVGDLIEYAHKEDDKYLGTVESINRCPEHEQCSDKVCRSKVYLKFSDSVRTPCIKENFTYLSILHKADNSIHKVVIV